MASKPLVTQLSKMRRIHLDTNEARVVHATAEAPFSSKSIDLQIMSEQSDHRYTCVVPLLGGLGAWAGLPADTDHGRLYWLQFPAQACKCESVAKSFGVATGGRSFSHAMIFRRREGRIAAKVPALSEAS